MAGADDPSQIATSGWAVTISTPQTIQPEGGPCEASVSGVYEPSKHADTGLSASASSGDGSAWATDGEEPPPAPPA